MSRLRILAGLACGATLLLLLGGPGRADEAPRPLVVLEEQEPQTTWPLLARTMSEIRLSELLFDRLFASRTGGVPTSRVFADGWQARGDELSVALREGLRFSNGAPVTFADVVFTINDVYRRVETGHVSAAWYTRVLGDARQTSPTTGRLPFEVAVPEAEAERYLVTTALFSRDQLERSDGPVDLDGRVRTPLGTGPFHAPGPIADLDDVTLARNRHRLDDGQPSTAAVRSVRLLYDQDAARQKELMDGGRADVWVSPPPAVLPAFRADRTRFAVRSYDLHQWWYVAVNPHNEHLARPEVREALDRAIPRRQLVDKLGGEAATLMSGPFLPTSAWRPTDLEPTAPDPEQVAVLMTAAGYRQQGGRWSRDGQEVALRLGVEAGIADDFNDVVYGLVDGLEDAGFRIRVRAVRGSEWADAVEGGRAGSSFDLVLGRWNTDREEAALELFRAASPTVNLFGWSSERTEQLIRDFYAESRGPRREALMQALHRHLHTERPYLFLWSLETRSIVRKDRVSGFRAAPYYFYSWFERLEWRAAP